MCDQAWSLVPKLNLLLWRPRIQPFSGRAVILGPSGSSGQGENTRSSSRSDCSGARLLLSWLFVPEWHALHEAGGEPCSVVLWCLVMTEGSPPKGYLVRGLYSPAKAKRHLRSLLRGEQPEMGEACGLNFHFLVSFPWSLWSFHNCMRN